MFHLPVSHTVVFHSGPSSTRSYAAVTKKKDCFPLLQSTFQLTGPFVNEFSLCILHASPLSPVLAHFGSLFLPLVTLFSPLLNKYPQNLFLHLQCNSPSPRRLPWSPRPLGQTLGQHHIVNSETDLASGMFKVYFSLSNKLSEVDDDEPNIERCV